MPKPLFRDYDKGDGFKITAYDKGSWTEYSALQLDAAGYVINRRSFRSCYRREAEAKITQWKAEDAAKGAAA
jgi:hypothetical protein